MTLNCHDFDTPCKIPHAIEFPQQKKEQPTKIRARQVK